MNFSYYPADGTSMPSGNFRNSKKNFRKIFAWNLKTYENISDTDGGIFTELLDEAVMAIDFNPQGKCFAFSTASNLIYIYSWNIDYRKISKLQILKVRF